ncbi:MAG: ABC transporter permease [Thermoanaerobaculia bacterium]
MSVSLDVRYGFRRLNQNVGSTIVAVICLALGVCGSVIVFSLSDFLLVRALPGVEDQGRLVSVGTEPVAFVEGEAVTFGITTSAYQRYRSSSQSFTQLAAYFHPVKLNVSGAGEPVSVVGQAVSPEYFTALGMRGSAGRLFSPGDAARGMQLEAVISHDLWRRLYGFRPQAVGASLRLNGRVFTVVGVAAKGFQGLLHGQDADVWLPLEAAPAVVPWLKEMVERGGFEPRWLMWFVGRLAPGVDREQAQKEMDQLASRLWQGLPKDQKPARLIIYPGVGFWPGYRPFVAEPLRLLAVIALLLMLVVCANLGGLLLVRAASHQEEIGVRLALGVTRGRLVRQLLSESLALALMGGAAGFILSLFAVDLLRGLSIGRLRLPVSQITLGFRVVLFTLCLSLLTGVLCGLVPALWATRRRAAPLRSGTGDNTMQRGHMRLQEAFVIAQVTVSLLLLVSTGLFVRTLQNLRRVDPGFASQEVLNGRMDLSSQDYSPARGLVFYDQLLEQVRQLPRVRAAALTLAVPLSNDTGETKTTHLRTPDRPRAQPVGPFEYNVVSPGFFATLGIPLRGRDFQAADQEGSLPVAIVDERLARILWPKRNPIGQRIALGNREVREVVGVAGQIRYTELFKEPRPFFYVPAAQEYLPSMTLQFRTEGNPLRSAPSIRAIVRRLDPNLAVQLSRFDGEVQQTLGQPRLFSGLLGIFSTTAVLVTAIGLYGTLSYAVSRRTRELGIRMALGARASEIVLMVLRRGLALTVIGLALGILAAVWATGLFSGMLFGVEPTDPGTFLAVSGLLTLVGLAASSLPAYRATRVDPMSIIRHE